MTHLMKWSYLMIILGFVCTSGILTEKIEVRCPEFCECDVYQSLRRATCQHKRLVSIELDIPAQAELLDISYNQISELDDKIFLQIGLTDLKLLNISHNKVHQIHFNGFVGLERLKTLDLSYNAIEYFTKSWFESLSSLRELYLSGNKLKSINHEPLIDIKTLRVLDLSRCGITNLNENVFTKVPNLEILDISDNYLQRLKVEVLKPLPKLNLLRTVGNDFKCRDRGLINVKHYILHMKITYEDPCIIDIETAFTINTDTERFQQMKIAPDLDTATNGIQSKNLWIFDDEEVNKTRIIEVCSNSTNIDEQKSEDQSLFQHLLKVSPWMVITITFVYGLLSGMIFITTINLCVKRRKMKVLATMEFPDGVVASNSSVQNISILEPRRRMRNGHNDTRTNSILYDTLNKFRRQLSRENEIDDDFDDSLMMNEMDLPESTPVPGRRTYL